MSFMAWVNQDLWGPIWPNLAASGLCSAAVVIRVRVHLRRHREAAAGARATDLAAHQELHETTHAMLSGLNDRLDAAGLGEDSGSR